MSNEAFKYAVAMMVKELPSDQLKIIHVENKTNIQNQQVVNECIEAELRERGTTHELGGTEESI